MMELAVMSIEVNGDLYFSQYWDGEISQNFTHIFHCLKCHQYYNCPGSKYGHPAVRSTGAFRLYLSHGVTAVVHGFTVCALDPKVEKELILYTLKELH